MKTLHEYAKENRISYRTAWNHFKQGKIPNAYKNQFSKVVVDEPLATECPRDCPALPLLNEILSLLKNES
jgi:hypothetical protein